MRQSVVFIIFAFFSCFARAQTVKITLSSQHTQKLSTIKSGHKRLVKFYKFYKKDSARTYRKQDRHYRHVINSVYHAEVKQDRINRRLTKRGIIIPSKALAAKDSISEELKRWWLILKDTISSDSTKQLARAKVKDLALKRANLNPSFQHLLTQYQLTGETPDWKKLSKQVPGMDSLQSTFNSSPQELFSSAEKQLEQRIEGSTMVRGVGSELSSAMSIKDMPEKYKQQYSKYANKDSLQAAGKQRAVKEAADYFNGHSKELQAAQQKASALLAKYKDYTNSNDLSKAVKQTSLKGKELWERIVLSGNFNIVSTAPVSIDLCPLIGYKFTTKFFMGIGMNYRFTYGDSIKSSRYISPVNNSFKAFVNYDIRKNFFAYAEYERSNLAIKTNDIKSKTWMNNYFLGIGKRFAVHPKLYMTVTGLYRINNETQNPVHPNRFQFRVGFQLSELATRKKKVYYDPNR